MTEYTPDRWVLLKICTGEQCVYKVLAGWSGGYLYGDSWKLNSGCTKIEDDGQCYLFYGYSGSVYRCHKSSYGLTVMSSGILSSFMDEIQNVPDANILMLPEETNFMEIDYGMGSS